MIDPCCNERRMTRRSRIALCFSVLLVVSATRVVGAEPEQGNAAAPAEAPLALVTVAGAPGDGEQALSTALAKRLSGIGIKQADAFGANVYSVEGLVRVTPIKGGRESIRIDWTVFGPDGSTIGGVSQTRSVRKGSLSMRWGSAADAAARAAAGEIRKLIPR
jgi:hypothetical protein